MIIRRITWGNILTIVGVAISVVYATGSVMARMDTAFSESKEALSLARSNSMKIIVIETKIEEGFKRLEELILYNREKE